MDMEKMKKNGSPKISVIVPVYNTARYLARCLDSIAAQTFTDWECICVDDGSTDESGAMLDAYARRDARFRVIHQENGGVSRARNAGLDAARGEWIAFVDSDDWVEPEMLEILYNAALENNAELSVCGIFLEIKEGKTTDSCCEKKTEVYSDKRSFLEKFCFLRIRPQHAASLHAVVNKLYSVRLLNTVRFDSKIRLSEDYLFNLHVFENVNRCTFISRPLYTYSYNSASATHTAINTFSEKDVAGNLKIVDETKIFYTNQNLPVKSYLFYAKDMLYQALVMLCISQCSHKIKKREMYIEINKHITRKILLFHFFNLKKTAFLLFCKIRFWFILDIAAKMYMRSCFDKKV